MGHAAIKGPLVLRIDIYICTHSAVEQLGLHQSSVESCGQPTVSPIPSIVLSNCDNDTSSVEADMTSGHESVSRCECSTVWLALVNGWADLELDWISIKAESTCLVLATSDRFFNDINRWTIVIQFECYIGICSCGHVIAGTVTQLKPCRVFCLLFLYHAVDVQ